MKTSLRLCTDTQERVDSHCDQAHNCNARRIKFHQSHAAAQEPNGSLTIRLRERAALYHNPISFSEDTATTAAVALHLI
eukprot:10000-Heterococcus_DN1.PRE.2